MKRSELIGRLLEMPGKDPEVKIFDYKMNLYNDTGEGASEGIYDPEVDYVDNKYFLEEGEDPHEDMGPPFIGLIFSNPDYEDDEERAESSEVKKRSFWELPSILAIAAAFALVGAAMQLMRLDKGLPTGEYICTIIISTLLIYNAIRFLKPFFKSEE